MTGSTTLTLAADSLGQGAGNPRWTNEGGAASLLAAVTDGLDTTYAQQVAAGPATDKWPGLTVGFDAPAVPGGQEVRAIRLRVRAQVADGYEGSPSRLAMQLYGPAAGPVVLRTIGTTPQWVQTGWVYTQPQSGAVWTAAAVNAASWAVWQRKAGLSAAGTTPPPVQVLEVQLQVLTWSRIAVTTTGPAGTEDSSNPTITWTVQDAQDRTVWQPAVRTADGELLWREQNPQGAEARDETGTVTGGAWRIPVPLADGDYLARVTYGALDPAGQQYLVFSEVPFTVATPDLPDEILKVTRNDDAAGFDVTVQNPLSMTPPHRNWCSNPSFETDVSGMTIPGARGALERDTTRASQGVASCKVTPVETSSALWLNLQGSTGSPTKIGLSTPGSYVTISYDLWTENVGQTFSTRVFQYDADGTQMGSSIGVWHDPITAEQAGTWVRMRSQIRTDTLCHSFMPVLAYTVLSEESPANPFWLDGVMVEIGRWSDDYFDGDSPWGTWTGEPDKSPSNIYWDRFLGIERRIDGGEWETLLEPDRPNKPAVTDSLVPHGQQVCYRARTIIGDVSQAGPAACDTYPVQDDWLVKSSDGASVLRDVRVITDPATTVEEQLEVVRPLGRRGAVVVSSQMGGADWQAEIHGSGAEEKQQLEDVLLARARLYVQAPWGWSRWYRLINRSYVEAGTKGCPRVVWQVDAVELS